MDVLDYIEREAHATLAALGRAHEAQLARLGNLAKLLIIGSGAATACVLGGASLASPMRWGLAALACGWALACAYGVLHGLRRVRVPFGADAQELGDLYTSEGGTMGPGGRADDDAAALAVTRIAEIGGCIKSTDRLRAAYRSRSAALERTYWAALTTPLAALAVFVLTSR